MCELVLSETFDTMADQLLDFISIEQNAIETFLCDEFDRR